MLKPSLRETEVIGDLCVQPHPRLLALLGRLDFLEVGFLLAVETLT